MFANKSNFQLLFNHIFTKQFHICWHIYHWCFLIFNFLVKSHSKCLRKHFLAGCFKVTFWFPKWRSPTGPEKVAYRCKNGNFEEVGWSWLYPDAPRWHIYLHEWLKTMMNVGHFPYMEHLGYKGLLIKTIIPVEKRTILNGNTFISRGLVFCQTMIMGGRVSPTLFMRTFSHLIGEKTSILFLIGSVYTRVGYMMYTYIWFLFHGKLVGISSIHWSQGN